MAAIVTNVFGTIKDRSGLNHFFFSIYLSARAHTHRGVTGVGVEVRGQLVEISFFPLPCEFTVIRNSDSQTWLQTPLLAESSHQPKITVL